MNILTSGMRLFRETKGTLVAVNRMVTSIDPFYVRITWAGATINSLRPALGNGTNASGLDVAGQFTAIGCKLPHDLLMQPDIHGGGVVRVASVLQFASELLASRQAAVETESLHQVDDRGSPGKLLALCRCGLVDDCRNVDGLRRWRAGRRCG